MLKTVKLYGHLGKKFGRVHRLDVNGPLDSIRAFSALYPEFKKSLVEHRPGYKILIDGFEAKSKDEFKLPGSRTISIVPLQSGAGNGVTTILAGVALIAAAFVTGGASIVATESFESIDAFLAGSGTTGLSLTTTSMGAMALTFGATLILGGISKLLSQPSNAPSYSFNGPVNTTNQGNSVPIVYGRVMIGSQVISSGLYSYDLAVDWTNTSTSNSSTFKGQI